jgi:hypothetical protein
MGGTGVTPDLVSSGSVADEVGACPRGFYSDTKAYNFVIPNPVIAISRLQSLYDLFRQFRHPNQLLTGHLWNIGGTPGAP